MNSETREQAIALPGKVLITGSKGFLGRYIATAYHTQGWEVISLGKQNHNDLVVDLATEEPALDHLDFKSVVHLAGLAHKVPSLHHAVQPFYDTNLHGTNNLLEALSPIAGQIEHFVFISSVAVYGRETGHMIEESNTLEGRSPYAQSKILAEQQVIHWGLDHDVPTLILRLPFVAGSNPPGEFGRLLRKMKKSDFRIIGAGLAKKSGVLASDIADHLPRWHGKSGIFNLTDGYHATIAEWTNYMKKSSTSPKIKYIKDWQARILSGMGDLIPGIPYHSRLYYQLTSELTFSDTKARNHLNWNPKIVFSEDWGSTLL